MAIFPGNLITKGAFIVMDHQYCKLSFCGLINDKKLSIRFWHFTFAEVAARHQPGQEKWRINLAWYKYFCFYLTAFLFDSGYRELMDYPRA